MPLDQGTLLNTYEEDSDGTGRKRQKSRKPSTQLGQVCKRKLTTMDPGSSQLQQAGQCISGRQLVHHSQVYPERYTRDAGWCLWGPPGCVRTVCVFYARTAQSTPLHIPLVLTRWSHVARSPHMLWQGQVICSWPGKSPMACSQGGSPRDMSPIACSQTGFLGLLAGKVSGKWYHHLWQRQEQTNFETLN